MSILLSASTKAVISAVVLAGALFAIGRPIDGGPSLVLFLDPWDGLARTARHAELDRLSHERIPFLADSVTVGLDARGVPHIFAGSDRDAIIALGYLVARERLFQLDYIARVASGRLSEAFGPGLVPTDRFLRQTGMYRAALENVRRITEENGKELEISQWFANGANTYIDTLTDEDLPLEFRLIGYRPERISPLHTALLLQFMIYDLTFETDDPEYSELRRRLGPDLFEDLFPTHNALSVPIFKDASGTARRKDYLPSLAHESGSVLLPDGIADIGGYREGKGSNNWVVSGSRSATGSPILAGDMHLGLSMPAIWYETHLVTPSLNTYGVTIPGAPLPVEAFNEYVAWAFTNTATDQIDFMELDLDPDGQGYYMDGSLKAFEEIPDTIFVKNSTPVVNPLRYSDWGPVVEADSGAYAIRWVAHEPNRNMLALWDMNRAVDLHQFTEATRMWDAPMQNIVVADISGDIAIRSTGLLPIRSTESYGLDNGSSSASTWTGRVPFDELPASTNPVAGYLTSTNQQPAGERYPYYLGHDWRSTFRSIRIDSLLRNKEFHSVDDFRDYHADVRAVQFQMLRPLLDDVSGLGEDAERLRLDLLSWDGEMGTGSRKSIAFDEWFQTLRRTLWDEEVFSIRLPSNGTMVHLLTSRSESEVYDITRTEEVESRLELLKYTLERTAESLDNYYARLGNDAVWGDRHKVVFRHLTRSDALKTLWRGPYPYPGFSETLSPGAGREVTHSASWRVIVDMRPPRPRGIGVYPGGQSGHPFSKWYDSHIQTYLDFDYFELLTPDNVDQLDPDSTTYLYLNP
ncbi:MAG: penicillin acylase family protein [Rhodothermales bacterium]|nr:penicillin acylase family protein [Rhodothermales bacterium]